MDIDKMMSFASLNNAWFLTHPLPHLCKGMPKVSVIESFELFVFNNGPGPKIELPSSIPLSSILNSQRDFLENRKRLVDVFARVRRHDRDAQARGPHRNRRRSNPLRKYSALHQIRR